MRSHVLKTVVESLEPRSLLSALSAGQPLKDTEAGSESEVTAALTMAAVGAQFRQIRQNLEEVEQNLGRIREAVARMREGGAVAVFSAVEVTAPSTAPRAEDFDAVGYSPTHAASDRLRSYRAFSSR
jgi:hypothetical protein